VRVSPAGRAEEYRDGSDFRFVLYDRLADYATVQRWNAEAGLVNGPLSLQGEFLVGNAATDALSREKFSAWYAQISYMLTGESRRYELRRGGFERPEPSRAMGAFEIAARRQEAERRDVPNAELTATDFGLTYYANANVRYMLNYTLAHNDLLNDSPRVLALRAQFDF
jgi:phosphate-selective porin OprO and OprP